MIGPVTSNVSAPSGFVANGHQALHFVSSTPSKIPYGGFSPVRLQTRFTQRPPSQAYPRLLIGRHCGYLGLRRLFRNRTCVQAAPESSDHHHESSGPWLPDRLYCPVRSSLAMATSAPLSAVERLMNYSFRLRDRPASRRGSPLYSASPSIHAVARTPVVPTTAFDDAFIVGAALRQFRTGSATTCSTNPNPVDRVTELQHSLYATAWNHCLPCSARTFTTKLSWAGSPQCPSWLSLNGSSSFTIAGLSPAGLTALWAASGIHGKRSNWRPHGLRLKIRSRSVSVYSAYSAVSIAVSA